MSSSSSMRNSYQKAPSALHSEFSKFFHHHPLFSGLQSSSVSASLTLRPIHLLMDTTSPIVYASDSSNTCSVTFSGHSFLQAEFKVHYMTSFQALSMRSMQWRTLKCFFENSFKVKDISSVPLKHLVKSTFVYNSLNLQITYWPISFRRGIMWSREGLDFIVHIIHQGWRVWQGIIYQIKGPSGRKVFLIVSVVQPFHVELPCDPSSHIGSPHDKQCGLVYILFLECTHGLGMVHWKWLNL